ncbi:MAG: hypothetical protein ACI35O_16255 [Bacillaceae bacterium]
MEVVEEAEQPLNWVKWTIPSYEYVYVKVEEEVKNVFLYILNDLKENNMKLVGAAHDYICPEENGQLYMFFQIKKL